MLHTGRHFLQIPGPTNVPDRVLRAMDQPVIDHRGPEFARLTAEVLDGLRAVFKTSGPVVIFPGSGTGAAEAALVNTLSPGDRVLIFETGHFSLVWRQVAERLGLQVEYVPGHFERLEHVRIKYACRRCEREAVDPRIVLAERPPQPIDKGMAGPGLLAYVVTGKFADYLPLYRLERVEIALLDRLVWELERDLVNVRWLAEAADELGAMLDGTARMLAGGERLTGEAIKRGEREIERALGDTDVAKSTDFPAKPEKSVAREAASVARGERARTL